MSEINFQIDNTALQTIQNTKLSANFEEMEVALTEFIEPYTKVIVSEDAIGIAKADRAKINAVSKHIDGYRKMVKKAYTEPLKEFEEKCKSLTAICDRGIQNIDEQVKEYEQKRINEKQFLIRDYYDNEVRSMNYPQYITFELALHPKWQLKGTSLDECKKYVDEAIKKVNSEVYAILGLHSEWETAMLADYQKTHDMLSAMEVHERMTRVSQQEAERRKKEQEAYEAKLKAQEDMNRTATELSADKDLDIEALGLDIENDIQKAIAADNAAVEDKEPVYVATFRVYGTLDEITAVRRYMNSHGIEHIYDGKAQTTDPIEVLL